VITLPENREVNSGATVSVTATVTDNENDPMTYAWQQTSGTSITLTNPDSLTTSFVAPTSADNITLSFTATDSKGLSTSENITLAVIATQTTTPPAVTPEKSNSSGGGSFGYLVIFLIATFIRKSLK
jgi:hypothetical protein